MKNITLSNLAAGLFLVTAWPASTVAADNPPPATADSIAAQWSDIKDCTHEMRAQFFVGLAKLEAKLDNQIRELAAKRAKMEDKVDTREWDFAMKELESARSYFKSVGSDLRTASRDTWDQNKDKVGRAWDSTQDACDKVKNSTTS